jgi:hypothetical protein
LKICEEGVGVGCANKCESVLWAIAKYFRNIEFRYFW